MPGWLETVAEEGEGDGAPGENGQVSGAGVEGPVPAARGRGRKSWQGHTRRESIHRRCKEVRGWGRGGVY